MANTDEGNQTHRQLMWHAGYPENRVIRHELLEKTRGSAVYGNSVENE